MYKVEIYKKMKIGKKWVMWLINSFCLLKQIIELYKKLILI